MARVPLEPSRFPPAVQTRQNSPSSSTGATEGPPHESPTGN
ncbi:hypothetical protein HMPREF0682_2742 [Propionibacterium acidifaciens F0233]|uniref:Uncharacterized protein n=1 Tax=Propionibacterium acidifaciens F0233 TaxID=553198 RepID=U2PXE2_9ACTN|nr:hypothetical protein HMPREF0682_2742 [Propionibacterium acidifaciens F0233]